MGVTEGLTFGPPLIMNGKRLSAAVTAAGGSVRVPRSDRKDGTMMFLVIDGRQPGYSIGATLVDVQNIMYEKARILRRIWTAVPVRPCIITAM